MGIVMDTVAYQKELELLADKFRIGGADVSIRGSGVGSFLVVDIGLRGAELYRGDDGFYLDPAEKNELLGPVRFESMQKAVEAAWHWLKDAVCPPVEID